MDIWSAEKRSEVMARIKGRDTRPERVVRSLLHALGYRFTVNGPRNKQLPGKPDIVLPKYRTVVFVHGCFWHGHEGCRKSRLPSTRRAWWRRKIEGNRLRDAAKEEELLALGWHVVTVWECATTTEEARRWLLRRLPRLVGPRRRPEPPAPSEPAPRRKGLYLRDMERHAALRAAEPEP